MYYKNVIDENISDSKRLFETFGECFDRTKKQKKLSNTIKWALTNCLPISKILSPRIASYFR